MSKKYDLFVLPSYEYYATYSGTKYLLNRLAELGVSFHVLLRIDSKNRNRYDEFFYPIRFFTWWNGSWPKWKRFLSLIAYRFLIFKNLLCAKKVLLCDSLYLPEVAWMKKFRPSLKIIHFCQELQTVEDYPNSRPAKFAMKYARIADMVIDVDPHRAEIRQTYYNLPVRPLCLYNTIPSYLQACATKGALWDLLGIVKPQCPIILYAGGCGVEKPFIRLIEAFAGVKQKAFFVAFLSASDSVYKDAVMEANQKLEKDSFIIHKGVAHKIILSLLTDADVGIVDYPFSAEPSLNSKYCAPTKFYEYMSAGLALVTSNNITLTSIVEPNQIGACAKDDSIPALSKALDAVCMDCEQLHQMRVRSAELFAKKYNYETINYSTIDQIASAITAL